MDRLQPDAADTEHQALRNGALRPTLGLSLPPDDEIVRMKIRHRLRLVGQSDCGSDGFGPDGGPHDRAKPAQLAVAKKIPQRSSRIDHRTLGVVTDEPYVALTVRGHHALHCRPRRSHPAHTP